MVSYVLNITTLINELIESKYRLLDFYQVVYFEYIFCD